MVRSVATNQPLAALQRNMPLSGANDTLPSGVTLSFLESQITASCALQSPTEFRHWLLATVNHLLDKGKKSFFYIQCVFFYITFLGVLSCFFLFNLVFAFNFLV